MIQLKVNNKQIEVNNGASVLDACNAANIEVPTLCYLPDSERHYTGCMVCVVECVGHKRLIPACSHPAETGMEIITDSQKIHDARKASLELLAVEHVGDCDAPCERVCPAGIDVPKLMRAVLNNEFEKAAHVLLNATPFIKLLAKYCSGACEKGCRRKQRDTSVSIRAIERYVSQISDGVSLPKSNDCGKSVSVIGYHLSGLTAAEQLARSGCSVNLYKNLDSSASHAENPYEQDIQDEIHRVTQAGVQIHQEISLSQIQALIKSEHAVISTIDLELAACENVFVSKNIADAVKAIGEGRRLTASVLAYLHGNKCSHKPFMSMIGNIQQSELFLMDGSSAARNDKPELTAEDAITEASRCIHCDCRKSNNCRFRQYCTEYGVKSVINSQNRRLITQDSTHDSVVFEPGKCVRCGICVRLSSCNCESVGMSILSRGYDVRIAPPLNKTICDALTHDVSSIVQNCPTGAFSYKRD